MSDTFDGSVWQVQYMLEVGTTPNMKCPCSLNQIEKYLLIWFWCFSFFWFAIEGSCYFHLEICCLTSWSEFIDDILFGIQ